MTAPDPRFALANERTVLAWVRTGLAFVAAGLGVTTAAHVLELNGLTALAGLTAVVLGAGLSVAAVGRWRSVQRAIDTDQPLTANRLVPVAAASVVLVAALALTTGLMQLLG